MINFLAASFAVAGAVAAAGPVVIHLLNRRRYRVVEWAAMDFLRQALQRNRKMLQLRDLLLLAIRTACVLLFGLALARPFWSSSAGETGTGGPIHAVLIVDNSMSMGYERLDGTLLDEAVAKSEEFIETLPPGSRVSVIPLCGSETAFSLDPYRTRDDAREALQRIRVVDRTGTAAQAIDLARDACKQASDLPAKRVVFLGDQQVGNWPAGALGDQLKDLPELQVVRIAAEAPENAWVEDFHVQDGIADVETTTKFFATIRYEGQSPRPNVQVTLEVDRAPVASRTVDLEPGQAREVQFPYRFDVPAEPGKPTFVTATVSIHSDSIDGDRLTADNQRFLVVPVVAALPVVFIDQFGEKENPQRNEYGETFRLRRLLAPITSRTDVNRQLVQVRHTTIERVDSTLLADARLVVIAGVASPGDSVPLLREYVEQGGQLMIAAGARFDPRLWSDAAWRDGAGILPAPLKPDPVGQLPEEATGQIHPFQLAGNTLVNEYFQIEDVSAEELDDLYRRPFFFKAVVPDLGEMVLSQLAESETRRITEEREFLTASDERQKTWAEQEARGTLGAEEQARRADDEQRRKELRPDWVLWAQDELQAPRDVAPADLAQQGLPRVSGAFDKDNIPFIVERQVGRGHIVFVSSGVYSEWNDLTRTNAVLVFDRVLRMMLEATLPRRNAESVEQLTIPVASGDRRVQYTLARPSGAKESLSIDALGADAYGVSIRNVTQCGHYLVTAQRDADNEAESLEAKLWEIPLAVNGPKQESQLVTLDPAGLRERLGDANYRWIEKDEPISLAGAQVHGQDLWKWLLGLVLVALLVELLVLAWPDLSKEWAPA